MYIWGMAQPWESESEEAIHTFNDQNSMSEPSKKGIRAEEQLALGVRVQVLKRVSTWDEGESNQAWGVKA